MTISEIHMIAEIFGSVFLAVSGAIIIFELHQNLKQRKIQNTFMRTIEVDKLFYKRMDKDAAILIFIGLNCERQKANKVGCEPRM